MNKRPTMLVDSTGAPIQGALRPLATKKIQMNAAGTARMSGENGAGIYRLVVTKDAYVAFGGASITASINDFYLPANIPTLFSVAEGSVYVAFRASGELGYAFLSEMV